MQKLDIKIQHSAHFLLIFSGLFVAQIAVIFWFPVGFVCKSLLLMGVAGYFFVIFQRHYHVFTLSHDQNGWKIDGFAGQLAGDSTITNWVSILRIESAESGKKRSWVIFRDAVPTNDYRELIVRARYCNGSRVD